MNDVTPEEYAYMLAHPTTLTGDQQMHPSCNPANSEATVTQGMNIPAGYRLREPHRMDDGSWYGWIAETTPTGWDGKGPFCRHFPGKGDTREDAVRAAIASVQS